MEIIRVGIYPILSVNPIVSTKRYIKDILTTKILKQCAAIIPNALATEGFEWNDH